MRLLCFFFSLFFRLFTRRTVMEPYNSVNQNFHIIKNIIKRARLEHINQHHTDGHRNYHTDHTAQTVSDVKKQQRDKRMNHSAKCGSGLE